MRLRIFVGMPTSSIKAIEPGFNAGAPCEADLLSPYSLFLLLGQPHSEHLDVLHHDQEANIVLR